MPPSRARRRPSCPGDGSPRRPPGRARSHVPQDGRRPVGREPLRDAVQRDGHALPAEGDATRADLQPPIIHLPPLPLDVRGSGRRPSSCDRAYSSQSGCTVTSNAPPVRLATRPAASGPHEVGVRAVEDALAVQPAELAARPVEAHHVLDEVQLRKGRVDRAVRDRSGFVQGRHRHPRAQRGGRAARGLSGPARRGRIRSAGKTDVHRPSAPRPRWPCGGMPAADRWCRHEGSSKARKHFDPGESRSPNAVVTDAWKTGYRMLNSPSINVSNGRPNATSPFPFGVIP